MSDHSLLFDDALELCDEGGHVSGGTYWFETLAEGASFGEPQPIEVAINSLLLDGALTEKQGDGNREQSFLVTVKSTDGRGIADGVAALHLATGKRTTLVWTPPGGYAPPTVFDLETSSLHEPSGFDDLAWKRNEQVFRLRLVALPFGRSVDKIVDDAGTPPSSGGTLLLNCESNTDWAATSPWTYPAEYVVDTVIFTEGAGSIRSRGQNFTNLDDGTASSSGKDKVSSLSLSTGTGGYLSVAVRFEWTQVSFGIYMTTASGGRVLVDNAIATHVDSAGFVHYVWPVDAGLTVTALDFVWTQSGPPIASYTTNPHHVWYDDVELLPAATTDHQIVKQLDVKGSARTVGSLRIAAPSESVALGRVLAITTPTDEIPAGFTPDGERWVAQGTTTPDAASPTGHYYTPDTAAYSAATGATDRPFFDVPVSLLTAGPYTMVALVKVESSPTVAGVQAQLRIGSTDVGPTSTAEVSLPDLPTGYQFVTLGTCYLPPLPMQSADETAKVRLLFKGAKLANIYFIPAWQVGGRPVADFSIVDCGTATPSAGGSSSSLWIDSPSASQPQGGWWRGPTADRANAQSAWPDAKKPGIHAFKPGALTCFVVSTNAQGPTATLEYYPAWLGSAAL